VLLIEPNTAGGWTVSGPPEVRALADLLDPEVDADKRQRLRDAIEKNRADLLWGGLSAEKLAEQTKLPATFVADELKSYAEQSQGLAARRLDGKMVLFREGASPVLAPGEAGGSDMPFIQRVKALFGRKGDNEKKLSILNERKALLSVQRDRAFEEMGVLEAKESELREQFKTTGSTITKKRITSHLVQLGKDLQRRQQFLGMLDQQINVLSTHLHNLELVQQGQSAALPNSEELAADAAAAEEVMAELQADYELAGSIGTPTGTGLSDEEQALFDELEREAAAEKAAASGQGVEPAKVATPRTPAEPQRQREAPPPLPTSARAEPQRGEAEPG
jgi:hypothetical protein